MFPPSRCTKIFKITLNTTTLGRVRTFDIQSSLGNVLLGELSRLSAKKVLLTFCELSCIIEISRVISMLTNMLPGGTNWPFTFRIKNFHFVCIWKVTLDALSSTLLVVYLQIFSPLVYVLYLCDKYVVLLWGGKSLHRTWHWQCQRREAALSLTPLHQMHRRPVCTAQAAANTPNTTNVFVVFLITKKHTIMQMQTIQAFEVPPQPKMLATSNVAVWWREGWLSDASKALDWMIS